MADGKAVEKIVELEGIWFERDGRAILDGIEWSIGRGEHWALLGANGSGKTTLLKIIAGFLWPNDGTVRVLGRTLGETDIRELRRHIGWVTSSLVNWAPEADTALQVVASGIEASIGLWREFSGDEFARAKEKLKLMSAAHLAERQYGVLSQGERQRVLIARALVAEPALLILDEPCAGLDPAAREHFLRDLEILAAGEDPPSILLVTHHIEEIIPSVSKLFLMKDGRTIGVGDKDSQMTSEALSELFGSECEVAQTDGRYSLVVR